jgi:hypothetical protein
MFVPPPTLAAPDGVGVYRKDPVLSDERQDRVGLVPGTAPIARLHVRIGRAPTCYRPSKFRGSTHKGSASSPAPMASP